MQESQRDTFRVTLSMRKAPEGTPVYCKMENTDRFQQLKTVKLLTESTYRIDVSFKPPRDLEFLAIQGKETEASERARDSTANAYSSYYSTKGLRPSKRGTREVLTLSMKVQGSGEVSTRLQVKLYKQRDVTHCEWGSKLHCIELDCSNYGANIIKETYRKIGLEMYGWGKKSYVYERLTNRDGLIALDLARTNHKPPFEPSIQIANRLPFPGLSREKFVSNRN